jgi:hypothetical protein
MNLYSEILFRHAKENIQRDIFQFSDFKKVPNWTQWFMLIIPTTKKAEIGRIMV